MGRNTCLEFHNTGRNTVAARAGLVLGVVAALICGPSLAQAQVPVQTVARSGEQAPGTPPGTTFRGFFLPGINNAGEVIFAAALTGSDVTLDNNNGIWMGAPGALQLVAREGDAAPGTPDGVTFAGLSARRLNQQGQVAFQGTLSGPGVTADNDTGTWTGVPGALQLVAREGDPAPGTSNGERFGLIFTGGRMLLSDNGDVTLTARLVGNTVTTANDDGFWAGKPGALQLVAREGDPAPGAPPGAVFNFGSFGSLGIRIHGDGVVVFNAGLTGGGTSGFGIWAGLPGNLTLVTRFGEPAPGTPPGVQFGSPRTPLINDAGEVAFGSFLRGTGVTAANNSGIWAGPPGDLQLVIRQGDLAPGTFGGETVDLGIFFPGPSGLNANGLVSLSPGVRLIGDGVTPENEQGIWFGPAGALQLIARDGDPAPGIAGDTVLKFNLTRHATNAADQVLFSSGIVGSEIPPGDGLWLSSRGVTELLIRSGDRVEIAPGEIVTLGIIGLITAGSSGSGILSSLNDLGQVVFRPRIPQLSQRAILILSSGNGTPVANAGEDATVNEGAPVTLDGSGSLDPQGDPLTFVWTQVAGPAVSLDLTDPAHPAFAAPFVSANATLTFELVIDDGADFSAPDTVDITVVDVNNPPVSDAGDDSTIKEGSTARLDGSNSFDPESDPLGFDWDQVAGVSVSLLPSETVDRPTFAAPLGVGQVLVFKLTVDDGHEASLPSPGADSSIDDTVAITVVENSRPVADAGADQTRDEGSAVTLDGAGADPDLGDGLSFQWTQTGGPAVALDNATSPASSFMAPAVGPGGETFSFALVVTDNDPVNPKSSIPDQVVVTVRNINDPPSCNLAVAGLDGLWPPNHKMSPVGIDGVMDGDSVYNTITLSITGVTQDEPVNGTGDGDSSPDAVILAGDPADTVLIRAERAANGDGRVYVVSFIASDGFEACSGSVQVVVPTSRKSAPIDSGQFHDSTLP